MTRVAVGVVARAEMHTVVRPHDNRTARTRARLFRQTRQLVRVLGPELHRRAGVDVGHRPGGAEERDPGVHDIQSSAALERAWHGPAHRRAGQVHMRAHAGEDPHRFPHVGDVLHVRVAVTHARPIGMVHARRESVATELEHHCGRVQAGGVLPHDVEVVTDRRAAEAAADRSRVGAQCDGRHEVVLRLPCEGVAVEDDDGSLGSRPWPAMPWRYLRRPARKRVPRGVQRSGTGSCVP